MTYKKFDEPRRLCKICGQGFKPTRHNHIFCSVSCQHINSKRKFYKNNPEYYKALDRLRTKNMTTEERHARKLHMREYRARKKRQAENLRKLRSAFNAPQPHDSTTQAD